MIRPEPLLRRWLRPIGDVLVGVLVFYAAFMVRIHVPLPFTQHLLPLERLLLLVDHWLLVPIGQVAVLYFFGLYDRPEPRQLAERFRRLVIAVTFLLVSLGAFFFLAERTFPRSVLVVFAVFDLTALAVWRSIADRSPREETLRLALVGGGSAALEVATTLREHPLPGLELVGWVRRPDDEPTDAASDDQNPDDVMGPCLGTVDELPSLLQSGEIDDVILASTDAPWKTRLLDALVTSGLSSRSNVLLLPSPFESIIGRMRYRWIRDIPLIEVICDSEWRRFRPIKRTVDLAVGSLLLVLAAPVLILCAVLIKATSPGPVFYRQERVGRGLQRFTLWKLRTMRVNAEPASREIMATQGDPRLTPMGAILRRYRLDELPQLFNVLGGSMSLVGPRPERPGFVQRYLEEVPGYAERFSIAPGLTGLAQINGEYHSTARNKLRYDLAYIANWSLWLDLAILVRTVKIVLTSKGV